MSSNPFAGHDIMVPEEYREHFDAYVQRREGRTARATHQPFARNIDMWFTAICVAVKKGVKAEPPSASKSYKAAEGVVLSSDAWRPTALMLLAVGDSEDPSIVDRPGDMLRIAGGYAAAGLPMLLTMLQERGGDTALDHLSERFEELLK